MAGTLKATRPKRSVQHLATPGEELWELWTFRSAVEGHLDKTLTLEQLLDVPRDTRIALPAKQMTSVPLWLQTTDPTLFSEMILVQLEKRGLWKSSQATPPLYHHVVVQEADKTLVFALVLNPELPAAYTLDLTNDYDFSARSRPLPMDGFTLWREDKRLALACTRQGQLAYLQTISSPTITKIVAQEILCLQLRLNWEKITLTPTPPIHFLGALYSEEAHIIKENLQTDAIVQAVPSPVWQEKKVSLTPPTVVSARAQQEKSGRWRQIITYVAWAYLVLLLLLVGQFGWLTYQTSTLRSELAAQTSTVESLENTSTRWKALQPAIDPIYYPLETLRTCVEQIPPQARMTNFVLSPNNVIIEGECDDAANAFKFLDGLKSDHNSKIWTWNMPQPRLLPNNRAQFRLEGNHGHATIE